MPPSKLENKTPPVINPNRLKNVLLGISSPCALRTLFFIPKIRAVIRRKSSMNKKKIGISLEK